MIAIAPTSQASDIPPMTTIAAYEHRFTAIAQRFAKIEGDLRLLTWMVGFNLATSVGIIVMLLPH